MTSLFTININKKTLYDLYGSKTKKLWNKQ